MSISTSFCGNLGTWNPTELQSSCQKITGFSQCPAYVAENPTEFDQAYWDIASISVFQKNVDPPRPPPPEPPPRTPPSPPSPPYAPLPMSSQCNSSEWASMYHTGWVDASSTEDACTAVSDYDNSPHVLVFSDEFETDG